MFHIGIQPDFSVCYNQLRDNQHIIGKSVGAFTSTAVSVASTILLIQEMQQPEQSPIILTACTLALGGSIRVVAELIPSRSKQMIVEGTTRWAFEMFEVLWNVYLNVGASAQTHLLNCISCWAGFHFAGDSITLLRHKFNIQGMQTGELQPLLSAPATPVNEEPPAEQGAEADQVKNQLLRPDFNNRKKIILLNAAILVSGSALFMFNQLHGWNRKSIEPFFNSLSYLLIGNGSGCLSIEISKIIYDNCIKRFFPLVQRFFDNSTLSKYMKKASEFFPGMCVEVISSIPITKQTLPLFVPVGFLYGAYASITQRSFQTLTQEVQRERIQENLVSIHPPIKQTAIKVDEVASVLFFTIFTAWFSYGLVISPTEERIEIGALLLSTWVMAIGSRILDLKFWPEANGKIFNECYYSFIHNALFLSVIYMMLTQVSKISDVDLDHDLPIQRAFGIAGLSLFGMMLAAGRMASISLAREEHPLTTPSFRMMSLLTIWYRCINELN